MAVLTFAAACSRGSDSSLSTEQSVETTLPSPSQVLKVTKVASLPNLPAKSAFTDNEPMPIFAPVSAGDIILHGGKDEPSLLRFDEETASLEDYSKLDVKMIDGAPSWQFSGTRRNLAFLDRVPKPEGDTSPGETLHVKDLKNPNAPAVSIPNVQGWQWLKDDTLLVRTSGRIAKLDPAKIETPVWKYELAVPSGEQVAPEIGVLDGGSHVLAYTKKEAKIIRLSDGYAWSVPSWTGAGALDAASIAVEPASSKKDFLSLFSTEPGQPGTLVQVSLLGSFKVLSNEATEVFGSTADRFVWGTPTGFTVHYVTGNHDDIPFEVPDLGFAQLVGDGFIYYSTTTNGVPMYWRTPDDGKGQAKKLIPEELLTDLRGIGFIPGPKGFFIVANNKLWETDFATGKYKPRFDGVAYSELQPVMNQEPANEPAVVVTVKDEGLALVPVKGNAVTLDHGKTRTWAGGWSNGYFVYATDTGNSHYQLRAITNEGLKDTPIGPEADEIVFHRAGSSIDRVLLRQGKDLVSVTVDTKALPSPAAPPGDTDDDAAKPLAPESKPDGHAIPIPSGNMGTTPPPGAPPAPKSSDSGCSVSHSSSTTAAPGLVLLGLAALTASRRSRRGRRP